MKFYTNGLRVWARPFSVSADVTKCNRHSFNDQTCRFRVFSQWKTDGGAFIYFCIYVCIALLIGALVSVLLPCACSNESMCAAIIFGSLELMQVPSDD